MSKRNKIEQKQIRRRQRQHAVPATATEPALPIPYRISRQLAGRPIDRVARQQRRAERRVRKAQHLLETMHPQSGLRPMVARELKVQQTFCYLASAEVKSRMDRVAKVQAAKAAKNELAQ